MHGTPRSGLRYETDDGEDDARAPTRAHHEHDRSASSTGPPRAAPAGAQPVTSIARTADERPPACRRPGRQEQLLGELDERRVEGHVDRPLLAEHLELQSRGSRAGRPA